MKPAAKKTGRSSRKGRRAKLSVVFMSVCAHSRERGHQFRPCGDALVECAVRPKETAGERLDGNRKSFGEGAFCWGLIVGVDGRQSLAAQLLGVVGQREANLLVVAAAFFLGGALPKKNGRP